MATVVSNLLPEVDAFLEKSLQRPLVGGKEADASDGSTFETHDPGSGDILATVPNFTAKDVDAAVAAAQKAFDKSGWATMAPNERGALLHRLADAVEKRSKIIAQIESLDAGKLEPHAQGDVAHFVATIRYFAEMAQHIARRNVLAVKGHEAWTMRHPWGPCGFIFPWNFPFLLIGWGISPALAAGNTVVIKPAEDTPLSAIYLSHLAQEVGIPDGVINVVTGTGEKTGAAVSTHKGFRRMSFTGSPEVGRMVGEACGKNLIPVKLELGGKGAAVVFEDVDVSETAAKLVGAITFHSGQVCCDATRWLVHKSVYNDFVSECSKLLKQVNVGYQMDGATQMGPVVNEKQRKRVLSYLEKGVKEGAKMIVQGGAAEVSGKTGHYVKPALMEGTLENVAAKEEIFGPVAYLAKFDSEDQAIAMVNSTDYGLANSVWSTDLNRCSRVAEQMRAGNSWINAHNVFPHGVPYGGIGKSGLGGGVNSPETLFDYWRSVSCVRPL
ncbi:MAG TPA: aldehyde dehydrogenase family protein [Lacipirellulaceae bacterium]|jgi:aldehyde dehydrogenase (NAD+)|nr:aldehyde dehydrogenase family protein [Lacipirellulaceae bacterium]